MVLCDGFDFSPNYVAPNVKAAVNQTTSRFATGFIVLVLIHSVPSGLTIKTEESIKEWKEKCFDRANDACKNQTHEACGK